MQTNGSNLKKNDHDNLIKKHFFHKKTIDVAQFSAS
jgi:hypothetical protein